MISLNDITSAYYKHRSEYIDTQLIDLKNQMSEAKSTKKLNLNKPKSITMGNLTLNVLNNLHDFTSEPDHNCLRCILGFKWDHSFRRLLTPSHRFLHENVLDKIPQHLIISKINYQSGMLTAAGNLKNNIKNKAVIIITTFICKDEKSLSFPVEYLVASSLNNWDIIQGESFLCNNSLYLSITSSYLNLTWDLLKYSVLLHYSKPKDTIGYILTSKSYILKPNETSWTHVRFILSKQSDTGMVDNDIINNIFFQSILL